MSHSPEQIMEKINDINQFVWNQKIGKPVILKWLDNFDEGERELALELLVKFIYYKNEEIGSLLKTAYNMLIHELCFELEKESSDEDPHVFLSQNFCFFGMGGNPSKSGEYLLLRFRQLNNLHPDIFPESLNSIPTGIERIVFIDDLIGSGKQAKDYWNEKVKNMSESNTRIQFYYLSLFGTEEGINEVKAETKLKIITVNKLTDENKVFSKISEYFETEKKRETMEAICKKHGANLYSDGPLGFGNSQLFIGFEYNTPDNTLPIIWGEEKWFPLFRRYW